MEAKDTVKRTTSHSETVVCPHCGEEFGQEGLVETIREEQAEISFKAGEDSMYKKFMTALQQEVDYHGKDSAMGISTKQVLTHIYRHKNFIEKHGGS